MTRARRGYRVVKVQLPEDLVIALRVRAVSEGRTVSSIVEEAVKAWLRSAAPTPNGVAPRSSGSPGEPGEPGGSGVPRSTAEPTGGEPQPFSDNPWVSIIRARSARA